MDDIDADATDDDINDTDDDINDADIDFNDADNDIPGRQPQDWSLPCNTGPPRGARTRQSLSAPALEDLGNKSTFGKT